MSVTVDIDLRDKLGDARDQRNRPTCLVFAVSSAHEARRERIEFLSTEFLFYMGAQRSHRDPNRGLTASTIRDTLQHDGQPVEGAWPYLLETPHPTKWRPPTISEPAHKSAITFSTRTLTEVRDVLKSGVPVLLVIALTTAMYSPDHHAIVRARAKDRVTTSKHALLAVGSGHSDDGEYILVRNSWGQSWGERGHCWLHDPYLNNQLETTAVVS